jgi:hypothetical protein
VVLDEPFNGLDPDGVRWIRLLLKSLAAEGRTVFVSSHLMSEMVQTATRLVVLGDAMSAVMQTGPVSTQGASAPATAAGPVTQVRVVRAEWTKLRALRSTWWCALITVVLIVGLGAAIAGSGAPYKISAGDSAAGGVTISLVGILFAQLVLGMLGVLLFSGEYATGMIRATLAVVPSRLPVLWAKLIVLLRPVPPRWRPLALGRADAAARPRAGAGRSSRPDDHHEDRKPGPLGGQPGRAVSEGPTRGRLLVP